jgi:hypothetical protein
VDVCWCLRRECFGGARRYLEVWCEVWRQGRSLSVVSVFSVGLGRSALDRLCARARRGMEYDAIEVLASEACRRCGMAFTSTVLPHRSRAAEGRAGWICASATGVSWMSWLLIVAGGKDKVCGACECECSCTGRCRIRVAVSGVSFL